MIPNFIFMEDSDESIVYKSKLNSEEDNDDNYDDRLDVYSYLENRWRIISKKIFLFIIFLSYYDITRLIFEILGCSSQNQIKYGKKKENNLIFFFFFKKFFKFLKCLGSSVKENHIFH
jgi:hypothetical protein